MTAISVTREPRAYEPGSGSSFFLDAASLADPKVRFDTGAQRRMRRYSKELASEISNHTAEGKRALRILNQAHRHDDRREQDRAVAEELRAMTSGAGSGGAFITPMYLSQNWVPALDIQPTFVRQTNQQPLPAYGMTAYVPEFQTLADVQVQSEGSGFSETDPTGGYVTSTVQTIESGVIISQQLNDRGRDESIGFDEALNEQLRQEINQQLDATAITLLSTTSTATVGVASAGALYTDVGNAVKRSLAAGTGIYKGRVRPTHVFMSSTIFEWLAKQVDSTGRPILQPRFAAAAPPWGCTGIADDDAQWSGFTGVVMPDGSYVFTDDNLSGEILVCRPVTTVVATSEEVFRVTAASTYATSLQLLAQLYQYAVVVDRVPGSSQLITGWNVS